MGSLRFLTCGESHGITLMGILEGIPAGLILDKDKINEQLRRRQKGYGRGGRMKIETDQIEITSGVRFGKTLGSPIGILIANKDWGNWIERMGVWEGKEDNPVTIPRPGHADLAGAVKYDHKDLRNILERASARETAIRVAVGSIVRQLLESFGIWIGSHVIQIQDIQNDQTFQSLCEKMSVETEKTIRALCKKAEKSDVSSSNARVAEFMRKKIDWAKKNGDSVGGIFELVALNVPAGLGSHVTWDRRLDAQIASQIMSIPAVKSVEIGLGMENVQRLGSEVHDPILPDREKSYKRSSNRAGGIEGGISNGEPILVRAAMKPIPTLTKPLPSIDMETGQSVSAHKERSDVCAVPAASVVGEALLAIVLGNAFCIKYGGDSIDQMRKHFNVSKNL